MYCSVLVFEDEDESWIAKITDFGLADTLSNNTVASMRTGGKGTKNWMAPEVYGQAGLYAEASDVWAFGMVMYEVFSRKKPYAADNELQIMRKVCLDEGAQLITEASRRPDLALVEAGCPPELLELMKGCWDQDPEERPNFDQIVKKIGEAFFNPPVRRAH